MQEFAYEDYWKALDIDDDAGLAELEEKGYTVELRDMTQVLVLGIEKFPSDDPRADCAEVRILDGPHKGKRAWVAGFHVREPVPNPDYKPAEEPKPKAAERVPEPFPPELFSSPEQKTKAEADRKKAEAVAKAESLLRQARAMEKDGNRPGALAYYRRVVKEFPDSSEAKAAAGRIKALAGGAR